MQPFDCRDRSKHTMRTERAGEHQCRGTTPSGRQYIAALDDLVGEGLAAWHQSGADQIELRCSSGMARLLDREGVTRLR